ncbi:hypothetical protein GE061_005145 [Apolygus lucorum]|uniref:Uncharacterized protein n=1 Tax=Apolygus lucorum TaxID=248454 RepID=A0A6A4ITY4_APOLU|nr:hypothetical protein GE061_005145 [Apolygus lucorum]
MRKFWALFALMMLAVNSASSVKKWTYYKSEYASKEEERRSSRGTSELGPHAYRGTKFEGPAWSVSIFLDDPELFVESPWYSRMRREAELLPHDVTTTLEETIQKYARDHRSAQSFSFQKWDGRASTADDSLDVKEEPQEPLDNREQGSESEEYEDYSLSSRTEGSDNRFIGNG